jgi:hypothetical protein
MMGGALGLAVLASAAASRTGALAAAGAAMPVALYGGYHVAVMLGAACALGAALLGGLRLRRGSQRAGGEAALATEAE